MDHFQAKKELANKDKYLCFQVHPYLIKENSKLD